MEGTKLAITAVILCFLMIEIYAGKEECKKIVTLNFKKIHKSFIKCHAEAKSKATSENEAYDKIGCSVKCVLKEDNLIDDKGTVSDDLMKKAVKGRVSPDFEDKMLKQLMDCKSKFAEALGKSDEKCKAHGDFGLCVHDAMSNICFE